MTNTFTKLVIDCSLPVGHPDREKLVPFTEEEISQRRAEMAKAAIEQAEREAAEAEKQANKESAKSKLEALGLSEDEINALIG